MCNGAQMEQALVILEGQLENAKCSDIHSKF